MDICKEEEKMKKGEREEGQRNGLVRGNEGRLGQTEENRWPWT